MRSWKKRKEPKPKNNFRMKCFVTIKTKPKNIDRVLINIMLKVLVPLGYSYLHNEETRTGIIEFNKNVPTSNRKSELMDEALTALTLHKNVAHITVLKCDLFPVKHFKMYGHAPIPYVDARISLDE